MNNLLGYDPDEEIDPFLSSREREILEELMDVFEKQSPFHPKSKESKSFGPKINELCQELQDSFEWSDEDIDTLL